MTTDDIKDYSWQFSPTLKTHALWVQYYAFGTAKAATFTPEDVAGVMWALDHCDGYTMKNGELMCEMDNRAGFGNGVTLITPSKLWDCLHPYDKRRITLNLLIEKEGNNEQPTTSTR